MTRTKTNVDILHGKISSIAVCAAKANDTATKEYLATTTKITAAKTDVIDSIAKKTTQMNTLLAGSLSNLPMAPTSTLTPIQQANNPNDYFIYGQKR